MFRKENKEIWGNTLHKDRKHPHGIRILKKIIRLEINNEGCLKIFKFSNIIFTLLIFCLYFAD